MKNILFLATFTLFAASKLPAQIDETGASYWSMDYSSNTNNQWEQYRNNTGQTVNLQIQVIATNGNTYSLSVSYPTAAYVNLPGTNYQRVVLATSTHAPKITHSGKSYKIDGVQFKLTTAGRDAINSLIGVVLPTDVVLFDTNLLPVLK